MTKRRNLAKLFSLISTRRRWQLVALFTLIMVGAVAEMATLGAVVPFLALIADPDGVTKKYTWLVQLTEMLGGSSSNFLLTAALLFSLIALVAGFIRIILMWFSLRISFGLGADIGTQVYRHTLYQPYSWHVAKNSSEIIASLDKINSIVFNIITPLLQGLASFVICLGILAMLLLIDYQTALIAGLGFLLLYGVTSLVLKRHLSINSQLISANLVKRIKAVQEGVGGIRDVLLDGTQEIYVQRFASCDYSMRRGQATNGLIGASPRYIIEAAGMVLIVTIAYWLTGDGSNGFVGAIPVLGALAIGAQKLLPQMQLVYYSWSSLNGNQHQLSDVLNLLDTPKKKNTVQVGLENLMFPQSDSKKTESYIIEIEDLGFNYNTSAPPVLYNINLKVAPGMHVGFIGKTGSGKSTLIDLVMGLLDPSKGSIKVNGSNLNASNMAMWQRRIAHVPQTIYLADASIEENIAFGVPRDKIDMERVIKSARRAQLSDYIKELPEQYQTWVGERGVRLSGGQRQRIGLARAFYKQADVLVLDEATSALDNATEHAVMESVCSYGDSLTVLMIAHRLSTLKHCDLIVELANGSITRTGSYEALLGQASTV